MQNNNKMNETTTKKTSNPKLFYLNLFAIMNIFKLI